jgi:hypothetical protein
MNLTKISSSQIDYILVFLMVVMSAGVSFLGATIFRFFLLLFVLSVILLRKKPLNLRNFKFIILFYLVWCAGVLLTFDVNLVHSGQLFTYLSFFTLVIASYYAVVALNNYFSTYIKVMYHLAIISFFFYALQLVNLDLLVTILRSFDGITSIFNDEISRPSIVIFTYGTDAGISLRNYGFATEPGEYSVFLILAMIFQVSLNNFKIDKIVMVLAIATLTTISTAGYIGLVVLLFYVLINNDYNINKLLLIIIGVPLILLILNLDFVSHKVTEAIEQETIKYELAYNERITPGRFGSLLLDFNDFKNNPIIGYGVHTETRYVNYGGVEQQRTNGVSDYLVKFGIMGFLIMLYNFYRTFKKTGIARSGRNSIIIITSIMTVTFSQVILATPFFLALQFYHFKVKKMDNKIQNYE